MISERGTSMKIAALILSVFLALGTAAGIAEASPINAMILVNGGFYHGEPFLRDEDGQWYVPLAAVSALTGFDAPVLEDGYIDWAGFWMDSTCSDFIFRDDTLYAALYLLQDAGMKVKETTLYGTDVVAISSSEPLDDSWAASRYVAHALGAIDGYDYMNCREAFEENYRKNFSVFEVDISMTADGVPVLVHEWSQYKAAVQNGDSSVEVEIPPTLDQFRTQKLRGEYTALTFEDLVNLMVQYPDITVITDMKETDKDNVTKIFGAVIELAKSIDPSVLDRIVPQVYNNEMIDWINALYPWRSMVYTFYMLPNRTTKADAFLYGYSKGIRVFTMGKEAYDMFALSLAEALDCKVYLHTVNDWSKFNFEMDTLHTWGIYTDVLDPLSMEGVETWADETVSEAAENTDAE